MTKEEKAEFERRIAAVVSMIEKLSGASEPGGIEIAISFYERLVDDLDAKLEALMDDEMRHSPFKSGGVG